MKNPNTLHACFKALALAAAALLPLAAGAQDAGAACELRIGGGPKGKLYELMIQDMRAACGKEVSVCAVPSVGGLQNLMMLSANQAELGIVQVDTLQEMTRGGDESAASLLAVMPLHTNLLHMVALQQGSKVGGNTLSFLDKPKVLSRFSDLKGMTIAVVGSTQILGQTLNEQFGHGMNLKIAESDDDAIKMLKANQVQAIFTDGGWPLPTISRHAVASGLMLVEFDMPARPPFAVVKRSYRNLDAFNLKFLGIQNLLVTRPFRNTGDTGKRVAALQSCLILRLEQLQEGRFQAAWKEVKNPMDTGGVLRFVQAGAAPARTAR